MVGRRRKARSSRSRNPYYTRSASRSRPGLRTRTLSKSPARKFASGTSESGASIVETKLRTLTSSPSPKVEKVRYGSLRRQSARTQSSVIIIDETDLSSPQSGQASSKFWCFVHSMTDVLSKHFLNIFSKGLIDLLGALFIPLFVYWCTFLAVSPTSEKTFSRGCSHHGCSIAFFGAALPLDLGFINPYVLFGVAFFNRITMLMNCLVPIGRPLIVIAGGRRWQHKCNGILIVVLYLLAVALYAHKGAGVVSISQLVDLRSFLPSVLLGAWTDALVFAAHAFLKSRHIRASTSYGDFLVDFYNGREIRPLLCGLDVKVLSCYASFIGGFILQLAFVIHQYHERASLSFGLMTLLLLHAIGMLDFFVYEPTVLRAHDVVHCGCGLRWFQSALLVWPFLQSLGVLYLAHNYRMIYPSWDSLLYYSLPAFGAFLFVVGLYIRRRATNQKFLLSYNPQRHSFEAASVLNSSGSRSIVAVGWWACVRHPDYLGEVISSFGLALTAGVGSIAPWIALACVFFNVLLRIRWDEGVGLKMYDRTMWEKYASAVPYCLIPRLY
ncbi:lamin b receptor [Echinococcus multilocularis]|uniref:Lamin b receptor n=1 Tax=Echinococcus multilocularis TaxID=6211 RepID=A0A068XWB0_ECHMU|nr:lamin b receptor [Echinococcus multilocularis]